MGKHVAHPFLDIVIVLILGFCLLLLVLYFLIPPAKIILVGDEAVTLEAGCHFEEPGALATRGEDDITDQIKISGNVEETATGVYEILYSVEPWLLFRGAEKKRTVTIIDTTAPQIILNGESHVRLFVGDPYIEPGYLATDSFDGDLTQQVKVEGVVNEKEAGTYTIVYTVSDKSENTTQVERTVEIFERTVPEGTPAHKIVYLTFDDGPSAQTEALLDVLDEKKVGATFFVTGANPDYYAMMRREAEEGHTVALHTFTHDYAQVYASEEAYFSDLESISELVSQETGITSSIIRFPGGSSNTISSNYNPGIMTRLAELVSQKGYSYFDWNVSSGDASVPLPSVDMQVNNIISGIQQNSANWPDNSTVVLQHDSRQNEHVSEVARRVIEWGQANDYYFEPIIGATPPIHHQIRN